MAAEAALQQIITDVRDTAAAGRAEAATALAHIDRPAIPRATRAAALRP